jgi:hypothetical protein
MVALGSILKGPDPMFLMSNISSAFEHMVNVIADPAPKVRHGAAWVMNRLADHTPYVILQTPDHIKYFVEKCTR